MKQKLQSITTIFLSLILILSLASCQAKIAPEGLWENATYRSDKEFGKGSKTVVVEVAAAEQTVTFTIHTDAETVGAALLEHDLIAGDEGQYGLYVKVVNGMTADYDVDQSYWAFYINGEMAMTGVDMTTISEGDVYKLVYTR